LIFESLTVVVIIVDIAIAYTFLEGAAMAAAHHWTGRGLQPQEYLLNLFSGLLLLLAVRSALSEAWTLLTLCLFASGVAHVSDIAFRMRRKVRFKTEFATHPEKR
jgi:hypothetical protein